MTPRAVLAQRSRSGITLTEILISILILAVGVISLATLFPIGLMRLRNAARLTRSGFLVESATADLGARNLLHPNSFTNLVLSPWYISASGAYNPLIQDTPSFLNAAVDGAGNPLGARNTIGPGLPVAYDPLWRALTANPVTSTQGVYITAGSPYTEARFGNGLGFVRNDPHPGGASSLPSAHGLQRITNFRTRYPSVSSPTITAAMAARNLAIVIQTFVSPEDFVWQEDKGQYPDPVTGNQMPNPSTVVPDMTLTNVNGLMNQATNDYRFSWMFTGNQSDVTNGSVFDGSIVVFENRQFGLNVNSNGYYQATGEFVVEAVWGFSTSTSGYIYGNAGFGNLAASRSVLLRWPATVPDPAVRVGSWIADVTYERIQQEDTYRFTSTGSPYPGQRCYWYQVTKKTEVTAANRFPSDPPSVPYRQMIVWVATPLRAKTLIDFGVVPPEPFHVEAALIAPNVVNVFPRTVYTR